MNLRKKLAVASIFMILFPIIVSVLLCVAVVFYSGDGTFNRLKNLYENDNGLLNVQTILYNYENEILSYKPTEEMENQWEDEEENSEDEDDDLYDKGEENDEDEDDDDDKEKDDEDDAYHGYAGADDSDIEKKDVTNAGNGESHSTDAESNPRLWEAESKEELKRRNKAFGRLTEELQDLGYSCQVRYGKRMILNSIPTGAEDKIVALAGAEYLSTRSFAVTDGESSAVKRTYFDGEDSISVLAYCEYYENSSHLSQIIRDFFFLIGLFAVALIVTIACSIFLLTRWLSGGMRRSLDQLSEGVKQIREGNLSYRIHSRKKDELGKACQEFDEMADYLENSVKEREKYEEARKQMLAGISHDLRTPLTSIKAYVEGLLDGIANTEEKKRRYYEALKTRTADLEGLIDNLSLFSRFDRGEYHYVMESIPFGEFLTGFFRENTVDFQENHLILEWNAPRQNEWYIKGDKKQLRRVLGNLIDNSLKYREKDELLLKADLYEKEGRLILELEDDGPGVPLEERDRIFDTFYRGDKARSNPGNGSGLGLSIVREILKGHGAVIRAEEGSDGRGLKMKMEFPLERRNGGEKDTDCGR